MLVHMGNHAGIVPELYCSDFDTSLDFYTTDCGFSIHYTAPRHASRRVRPASDPTLSSASSFDSGSR